MKRLIFSFLAVIGIFQFSMAQNYEWPNALSVGGHANDYYSPFKQTGVSPEFFEYGLQLAYHRQLVGNFLNLEVPFRMGTATVANNEQPLQEFTIQQSLFSVSTLLQLQYYKPKNIFIPYLSVGPSYTLIGDAGNHLEIPIGVGVDIKMSKGFYFQLRPEYRYAFTDNRNNWNFYAGIKFNVGPKRKLPPPPPGDRDKDGVNDLRDKCPDTPGTSRLKGCPDRDKDGVADLDDLCPDEKGVRSLGGCPDADKDGIIDSEDECPKEKGPKENKGCPYKDTDGDRVTDNIDKCPNVPGAIEFDGCPDTDLDGIPDNEDECPEKRGPKANNGCPASDKDNDGVIDIRDNCPTLPGPASNAGCPEKKIEEVVNFAAKNIRFENNSSQLLSSSNSVLDEVANILLQNPGHKVSISGHTDSVGNAAFNLALSERRAAACATYLQAKGIDASRISSTGYGETQPIADNATNEGRKINRRVEFNVFK